MEIQLKHGKLPAAARGLKSTSRRYLSACWRDLPGCLGVATCLHPVCSQGLRTHECECRLFNCMHFHALSAPCATEYMKPSSDTKTRCIGRQPAMHGMLPPPALAWHQWISHVWVPNCAPAQFKRASTSASCNPPSQLCAPSLAARPATYFLPFKLSLMSGTR